MSREESILEHIQPNELYVKLHDPTFMEDAQLVDVREPEEVYALTLLIQSDFQLKLFCFCISNIRSNC